MNDPKEQFIEELKMLLRKYDADILAKDHYDGYPECGEDIRMTVTIPAIYDGDQEIRKFTEIDLGSYLSAKSP